MATTTSTTATSNPRRTASHEPRAPDEPGRGDVTSPMALADSARAIRPAPVIRAVTFDCWGTLFLDGPAADEGYRRQRLAGMEAVLGACGVPVAGRDLERAYAAAG